MNRQLLVSRYLKIVFNINDSDQNIESKSNFDEIDYIGRRILNKERKEGREGERERMKEREIDRQQGKREERKEDIRVMK